MILRWTERALHLATLLMVLAGAWGVWQMARSVGVDGAPTPNGMWTGLLWDAVAHPLLWGALAVAWFAARVARRLEVVEIEPPAARPVHRVSGGPDGAGAGAVKHSVEHPVQLVSDVGEAGKKRRRRSERRLRMEAFLRGDADVPAFVDEMLGAAVEEGASDIHVEAGTPDGLVRFRVRGELRDAAKVPQAHHRDLVRRLKVMSRLVPYEDKPQDGRMTVETPWGSADVRVSVVPTGHGEKIVLRLAGDAELLELSSLGLQGDDLERMRTLLREPQGLVIVTGPTGSGKTTTLYSSLAHVRGVRPGAGLASIEDPIEVELPFLAQTQVDRARGLTFAGALRSVLRQDPDVLMVGEIRDGETAKIAVQAGLSGHLVLTTLHAASTPGIFPRLIDLGVEPFLAASSTLAGVSQRLLPRLCAECRRPRAPTSAESRQIERAGIDPAGRSFHDAEGCSACDGSGRRGRIAVFEILRLDAELRKKIAAKIPAQELFAAAHAAGLVPLTHSALSAAARGEVALVDALALSSEIEGVGGPR